MKPKKKNTTAYQVFCKEYRVNINAEQPGLGEQNFEMQYHFA